MWDEDSRLNENTIKAWNVIQKINEDINIKLVNNV